MPWEIEAASSMYPTIAPFIPVTIENSTCDISSATIGTLFSCVVCVSWTKIQGRYCCLCFVVFTQCDVCQSRKFQHKHNIRREKRKKNDKIDESSKIERMVGIVLKSQFLWDCHFCGWQQFYISKNFTHHALALYSLFWFLLPPDISIYLPLLLSFVIQHKWSPLHKEKCRQEPLVKFLKRVNNTLLQ